MRISDWSSDVCSSDLSRRTDEGWARASCSALVARDGDYRRNGEARHRGICFSRPQAQEAAIDDGDADAASPYDGECQGTRFPLDLPRLGIGDAGLYERGLRKGSGAHVREPGDKTAE